MDYPDIVLKKGMNNPKYVRILKKQLNELGFGPLTEADPDFGNQTAAVVKAFQKTRNLIADGEVGALTWHRLFTPREPVRSLATELSNVAVEYALTQLYVREKTGKNDGPQVEAYLKAVGLPAGYAWCVAFAYWCFSRAAGQIQVQNPMIATAGVMDLWRRTPDEFKFTEPAKGRLGIYNFGKGKGHLFLVKSDKLIRSKGIMKILTIEGNTAADPTTPAEDRDGQGVYERLRPQYSNQLEGYIGYP